MLCLFELLLISRIPVNGNCLYSAVSVDVEVSNSEEANELAMAMRMLANDRFLHIEFQTSSFCLDNSRHFSVYRR